MTRAECGQAIRHAMELDRAIGSTPAEYWVEALAIGMVAVEMNRRGIKFKDETIHSAVNAALNAMDRDLDAAGE